MSMVDEVTTEKLFGISFVDWAKVKRCMNMEHCYNVDQFLVRVDEAFADQKRYNVLVAGLKEIQKVLP